MEKNHAVYCEVMGGILMGLSSLIGDMGDDMLHSCEYEGVGG